MSVRQWATPGRVTVGALTLAGIVAALAAGTGGQRAQSLGLTRHGELAVAVDAGAADVVGVTGIAPGTPTQVLTVSDSGVPVWRAIPAGVTLAGTGIVEVQAGDAGTVDGAGAADASVLTLVSGVPQWAAAAAAARVSYTLDDFAATAASGTTGTSGGYRTLGVSSDPIRFDNGAQTAPRYTLALPAGARRVRVRWRVQAVPTGTPDGYDVAAVGWYDSSSAPARGIGAYQILTYAARASTGLTGSWTVYPGTDLVVGGLGGSAASTTWSQLTIDVLAGTAVCALGTGSGDTPPTTWTTYTSGRLTYTGAGSIDADTPGVIVVWIGRPDSASAGAALDVALDVRVEIDR